jgi:hypothetical protein
VNPSGGTFDFTGQEGNFLIVDFAAGPPWGVGPFEVMTILDVVSATQAYVAGQGSGGGFPNGRNAASYPTQACVIAEPSVSIKPTTVNNEPVIMFASPNAPLAEHGAGQSDDFAASLTWVAIDGTTCASFNSLITNVPLGIDCCTFTNNNGNSLVINHTRCVMGEYWGNARFAFSNDVTLDSNVSAWDIGTTGAGQSYLNPANQGGQRRHAGRCNGLTDSIVVRGRSTATPQGLLVQTGLVNIRHDASFPNDYTSQFEDSVYVDGGEGRFLDRAYLLEELKFRECSHMIGGTAIYLSGVPATTIPLEITDSSKIQFKGTAFVGCLNPGSAACVRVDNLSSFQVDNTLFPFHATLPGGLLLVTTGAKFVGLTVDVSQDIQLQQAAIRSDTGSYIVIGTIIVPAAAIADYGSDGVLLAQGNSDIQFNAVTNVVQNTAGPGMSIRYGSSINTPNGFGNSPSMTGSGSGVALDLGGLGQIAYAPGSQSDISAAMPQMCIRLER